jgi:hypothetical protein
MTTRTHATPMGVELAEQQADGSRTLEPRFLAILSEQTAHEQRVLDEALRAPWIEIRITDDAMTLGQIVELATGLSDAGYTVHSGWVRNASGDIVGIAIDAVQGRDVA